ncbi:uncharacterized protein N7459_000798 [Penicillium hispanicum]|uniref:uncharacterized protein n=1 Tax=Penicillium hispanicum TaxID=1080232 RepID=UPI00254016D1|nr:uncharacterized protein N7459_000798 [Penicillium hispanicum]KAJ5594590.1 hypothetical protein N7459_000798 [Penicillium hispanicum]
MQFTKSLLLLAALTTGALARVQGHARRQGSDWTSVPATGAESTAKFGQVTNATGSGDTYKGNVGNPYGSNIAEVEASAASSYKYVVQFQGSNTEDWTVVIWNKYSSSNEDNGWAGKATKTFTLSPGATKYYAFDEDSQGGWAAAAGSSVPTNNVDGAYSATWGEFDFGSSANDKHSGFDVSCIQAQVGKLTVQGMQICSKYNDNTCSSITSNMASVDNAYTEATQYVGGIGGNLNPGPVRLAVTLDYSG